MNFDWVLQVPILFFSIIVHEFSHGWAAFLHGDDTAERHGRLTLNPLPHVDVFGTLLLPALCALGGSPIFGWAKPVPVDPSRLRGRWAVVTVSLVGPLSNIALAVAAAIAFRLSVFAAGGMPDFQETLSEAFRFGVILNLYLAAFNLVPIYPLDGSQALAGFLPERWAAIYEKHAPYGFLIILFLLMTGLLSAIIIPFVRLGLVLMAALGIFW